jgi:hypothetical protein
MKNLACRLTLAAGVIAGLLTATIGPAPASEPPGTATAPFAPVGPTGPVAPPEASVPVLAPTDLADATPAPGGTSAGVSQLGDVLAACPEAVPSGGTDAPAIPSLEGAAALDDLVATAAAGPVDACGVALALVDGAGAEDPPALGGPAAPGDLAGAAQTPPDGGSHLVDVQLDLGVVCRLVGALLGDAAPCPPPESPGTPTNVVDLPGLLRLQLLGL